MSDNGEPSDEEGVETRPTDPPGKNVEHEETETDSSEEGSSDGDGEMGLDEALELVEEGRTDEIPERELARLRELSGELGADEETGGEAKTGDETEAETSPDSDLHERLEMLEQQVSDLQEQLDSSDGKMAEGAIAEVEQRIADQGDRLAQLQSEFEEHREHAEREREKIRKYSLEEFAMEVIRVKDSIERAIEFLDLGEDAQEQLELIDEQFQQALERSNLTKVEADGTFDLDRHKVIDQEHSGDHEPDEIVRTEKSGYRLHDRVIRPAEVVIAAPE